MKVPRKIAFNLVFNNIINLIKQFDQMSQTIQSFHYGINEYFTDGKAFFY